MYLLIFFPYNTFCHLRLIYHMRLVLGDYRDFNCKMSLATKILLQTLVKNTQFSSSVWNLVYSQVMCCRFLQMGMLRDVDTYYAKLCHVQYPQ
jgi:hypothetical protein